VLTSKRSARALALGWTSPEYLAGVRMTIAICTKCGTEKFGSFSPCELCGFTPTSNFELAESIILSDHHYTHDELRDIGEEIKSGYDFIFDPSSVAEYAVLMDEEEEEFARDMAELAAAHSGGKEAFAKAMTEYWDRLEKRQQSLRQRQSGHSPSSQFE
jgi:hypothetical protein